MKALVVSGGGAKGAFAGGIAEYLIKDLGKEYSFYSGTSTGNLLINLLAIEELSRLKEAYTSVSQKDIFKVNPFKIKVKGGETQTDLHLINVLYNIVVRKQKTFGDSSNLRTLISKNFTEADYNLAKEKGKEIVSCVVNLTDDTTEYKSIFDYSYEDFCDWIWISANATPFMSLVVKNGKEYCDGGIKEGVPLQIAIDKGATEIDVIVLSPQYPEAKETPVKNALDLITRMIDSMLTEITKDDLKVGELIAREREVTVNVYYTPRKLTNNSLVFNKEEMLEWWEEGYLYAKGCEKPSCSYILTPGKKKTKIKKIK
jgi:NTE family protein